MPIYFSILNSFKQKQNTATLHAKIPVIFLWNIISRCETS